MSYHHLSAAVLSKHGYCSIVSGVTILRAESLCLKINEMSKQIKFDILCPNNHDQTVAFTREEFERTLSAGALQFHCNTCDTDFEPSGKIIEQFRREFKKAEHE
jgi:hypothetical protein